MDNALREKLKTNHQDKVLRFYDQLSADSQKKEAMPLPFAATCAASAT